MANDTNNGQGQILETTSPFFRTKLKKKYMGKYKKTKSSNLTLLKKLSKEYFPVQV